jgi:hypothetical protein
MKKSDTKIPVIVVGMTLKELHDSYRGSLIAKKAGELWYLKGKDVVRRQRIEDVESTLEQLCDKGQNEVEIIGSYTDCCVADAVECALKHGMTVYVPDDKVLCSKWEKGRPVKELLTTYVDGVGYNYEREGNMHKFMPKTKK